MWPFLTQGRRKVYNWYDDDVVNSILDPRDCSTEVQTVSGETATLKAETKLQPPSKEVCLFYQLQTLAAFTDFSLVQCHVLHSASPAASV